MDLANAKMAMNPFDEIAVEEAIRLKEKGIATEIVAVSLGVSACRDVLLSAMAMGADRGILIEGHQAWEPLGVATLFKAVVEQEMPSLIMLGKQAIDDDCNQTGQMLAALLGWPQATFASQIIVKAQTVTVTRETDDGQETLQLNLPAVVTVDLRLNQPRYASLINVMKAKQKPISVITPEALNVTFQSYLEYVCTEAPPARPAGVILKDVPELVTKLKNEARVI
jgi:electron transfer flavoprotein beta subunit